jgi:hypothetical protein
VQQLVQDMSFLTAVQTSQLHAAATAAVRLVRAHFSAAADFKRPADRRGPRDGGLPDDATPRGAAALGPRAGSLVVQRAVVEPRHREALRVMRLEVLGLEDVIPWNSVRRNWKAKVGGWRGGGRALAGQLPRVRCRPAASAARRLLSAAARSLLPPQRTTWRRQVKQTEVIADFASRLKVGLLGGRCLPAPGPAAAPLPCRAACPPPVQLARSWRTQARRMPRLAVQELRTALLTDDQPLPGCGGTWRAQLDVCAQGKGSYGLLAAAWEEMRTTIRNWLDGRSKPQAQSAAQLQAGAARAVRAMHAALAAAAGGGGGGGDPDAAAGLLLQVPLESIVGNDSGAGLAAVRSAIEMEQRMLGARLAGRSPQQQPSDGSGGDAGGGGGQQPLVGYFSSISAALCDSDFDSAGESEAMDASDATDLDSDYDP